MVFVLAILYIWYKLVSWYIKAPALWQGLVKEGNELGGVWGSGVLTWVHGFKKQFYIPRYWSGNSR